MSVTHDDRQADSTLSPPHERALARALGLELVDGLLPWAALQARALSLPDDEGQGWALLTLCHWQVGMSEVVMNDPRELGITAEESASLLAAVHPFFAQDGLRLFATAAPGQWLVCGRLLQDLPSAALDRVIGQPLDGWMPMSDAAAPLRRLLNEMQMLLYTSCVNEAREMQRQLPINSFWLSGTGRAPQAHAGAEPEVAHELRACALQDDAAGWQQQWVALDAQRLAPLAAQAKAGQPVRLTLCGTSTALQLDLRPRGPRAWLRSHLRKPHVGAVLEAL